MLIEALKKITEEKFEEGHSEIIIVNYLKEYLQLSVLDFIYNNKKYDHFIFTGGSCLRICYNLPRLSEDIDFDLKKEKFEKVNLKKLDSELKKHFQEKFLFHPESKIQGEKRIYLKFDLLDKLNLSYGGGSNILYVKIELEKTPFLKFQEKPFPILKNNFNLIANTYSLSFLMTGKILAILNRDWFKGKDNEINIKGRDFYDLYWYFDRKVKPDIKSLNNILGIKNEKELKETLLRKIEKDVTSQKMLHDLENFFSNQKYISDFCKNYKKIMREFLKT